MSAARWRPGTWRSGIAGKLWIFVEPRAPISTAMLRDRELVRRLDDRHEVVRPEHRPLVDDPRAHRLDLRVDLLQAARVALQRLDALAGQRGEEDERGHGRKPTAARRARCRRRAAAASASSSSSSGASCDGCPRRSSAQAEQRVGQPAVLRQQRAVHVRADDAARAAALRAVLAVVAAARDDAAQRLDVRAEPSCARRGSRTRPCALHAVEAAVDQHVADDAGVAGDGLQVDEAGAEDLVALVAEVAVAEQLVAAADREQRRALGQRLADRRHLAAQLVGHQHLVAVLAAADEDDVGAGRGRGASPKRTGRTCGSSPRQRARCSSTRTLPRSA